MRYAFLRSEFSSPRDVLCARILQNRAASPFLHKPFGKSGKKGKSVVLSFSSVYLNSPSSQKQRYLQTGVRYRKNVVLLAQVNIKMPQIHSFLVSRKHTANRVRFLRSAVLKRAVNYLRAASPFLHKPFGKSGEKGKSVVLPFSSVYLNSPSSQKQRCLQIGLRCASNAVNFAERPLADI